jgi:Tfp pilus assembly protein PilF
MLERFNVRGSQSLTIPSVRSSMQAIFGRIAALVAPRLIVLLLVVSSGEVCAQQGGGHMLFGDLKVDESQVEGLKPLSFDIILYSLSGIIVGRQSVPGNGRYRFLSVVNGQYDLAVEVEGTEVARVRLLIQYPFKTDHRHDLFFEWHGNARKRVKPQTVSAADFYERTPANKSLFGKAQRAMDEKRYEAAVSLLVRLHNADSKDFQAWTELGTAYLMQGKLGEAEKAYRHAIKERPGFGLALFNLGKLLMSQKKFDEAIEPLAKAVAVLPMSADANHLLGEAYLGLKKGSKAVGYLNEAIRLDPRAKADVHLRLAALYSAAGMKDRAIAEYRQFLSKRPDHVDRKKLERYITENEKR